MSSLPNRGRLRAIGTAVAFATSLLAPSATEAKDLQVDLAVAKSELLVCEPLVALVTLKGTRPVLGEGSDVVYLLDRGSGFVPYQRPIFATTCGEGRKPQSLPPEGLLIETILSYDAGTRDCVLPSAGRYRVVAEYREKGWATIRSPIVALGVKPPTGDEAEAFAELAKLGRLAFYVGEGATMALKIGPRHPASVYVQYARFTALQQRIRHLWQGHDSEDPGAHAGHTRSVIEEWGRQRIARLLPDALDLVETAGQFTPQALGLLAGVQEAAGESAGARATYERIVRDHPKRSEAEGAREALEEDEE